MYIHIIPYIYIYFIEMYTQDGLACFNLFSILLFI